MIGDLILNLYILKFVMEINTVGMESVSRNLQPFFFLGTGFFPACFRFRQDDEARSMGRVQAWWVKLYWIYPPGFRMLAPGK